MRIDPSKHVRWLLRLGLAFVFGWFGVDKFLNVDAWYGWIPFWLDFVPETQFLYAVGVIEVILAFFLLINRYVRLAALVCAAFMIGIVVSFGINEITVRDIGLIAMALALALFPEKRKFYEPHEVHKEVKKHKKR